MPNQVAEKMSPRALSKKLGRAYRKPPKPKRDEPVWASFALYLDLDSKLKALRLMDWLKEQTPGDLGTAKVSVYDFLSAGEICYDIEVEWRDDDEVGRAYVSNFEATVWSVGLYKILPETA